MRSIVLNKITIRSHITRQRMRPARVFDPHRHAHLIANIQKAVRRQPQTSLQQIEAARLHGRDFRAQYIRRRIRPEQVGVVAPMQQALHAESLAIQLQLLTDRAHFRARDRQPFDRDANAFEQDLDLGEVQPRVFRIPSQHALRIARGPQAGPGSLHRHTIDANLDFRLRGRFICKQQLGTQRQDPTTPTQTRPPGKTHAFDRLPPTTLPQAARWHINRRQEATEWVVINRIDF